jgi:hypothetical protein
VTNDTHWSQRAYVRSVTVITTIRSGISSTARVGARGAAMESARVLVKEGPLPWRVGLSTVRTPLLKKSAMSAEEEP